MSNRRNLLLSYLSNSFKWLPYSFEYLYHSLIPTSLPAFNLFNKNATFVNAYCDGSGVFYPNSDMQSAIIEVQPNTTLYFYTNNKDGGMQRLGFTKDYPNTMDRYYNDNGLNTFNTYTNGTTIVVPDHYRYMILTFYRSGVATDTLQDVLDNLCINVSSSQNGTYKPYKELSVKNKAKVSTIYGNSVVENQGESTTNATYHGINSIKDSDNVITSSGTIDNTYFNLNDFPNYYKNGDYVLVKLKVLSMPTGISSFNFGFLNQSGRFNITINGVGEYRVLSSISENGRAVGFSGFTANTQISNFKYKLNYTNLTQAYPFDTPTTLTDNRVQALLNRGYIAYNTGELKSVDIGEFSTTKTDTTALATLPFKYQGGGVGTSHDTMEINKDNVVFTKDRARYTFTGSENWNIEYSKYYTTLPISDSQNIKGGDTNKVWCIVCNCLQPAKQIDMSDGNVDKAISTGANSSTKVVCVRDTTNITSISTAQSYMADKTIEYQLATPQTITIPRKHLGCIDLGTIGLSLSGGYWRATITNIKIPATTSTQANIYCSAYLNDTYSHLQSQGYMAVSDSGMIYIKDSTKTQASDFSGIYLFYETQNEVADILDTINIEAGGTINANWFSWVKNQQIDVKDLYSHTQKGITFSKDVANQTITLDGTCDSAFSDNGQWLVSTLVANHIGIYRLTLISGSITLNGGSYKLYQRYASDVGLTYPTSVGESLVALVPSSNSNRDIAFTCSVGVNFDNAIFKLETIDLTLGGIDTTDINDPRIQYILKQGYIPTNTSGTLKNVDCEVLPNVKMGVKCK